MLASIPAAATLGVLRIELLYGLALLLGACNTAFDIAHQAFVPSIVSSDDLVEANSRLEISRSGALIVGPSAGGWLVQLLSAPIALLVDSASFVVSAAFLLLISTREAVTTVSRERTHIFREVLDGIRFVSSNESLRSMGVSLLTFNFFSQVLSANYLLYLIRDLDLPSVTIGIILGLGNIGFLFGAAFAMKVEHLRQAITPPELQGRVNATMLVVALGASPIGALAGGLFGQALGLYAGVLAGAVGMQLGFLILLLSPLRAVRRLPRQSEQH
jgi:MFS family permease